MSQLRVTPTDDLQKSLKALKAGDTLTFADGVYKGGVKLSLPGNEKTFVTLRAENTGKAIIEGGARCLSLSGTTFGVIDGLTFQDSPGAGLYATSCNHLTLKNCVVRDNGTAGVRSQGCLISESDDVTVDGCEFSGTKGESGVYFSRCLRVTVKNCSGKFNRTAFVQFNWQGAPSDKFSITNANSNAGTITNCKASGCGIAAVNLLNLKGASVTDCDFYDNQGGVNAFASVDVSVDKCIIRSLGSACIMANGTPVQVSNTQFAVGKGSTPFQVQGIGTITEAGNSAYVAPVPVKQP